MRELRISEISYSEISYSESELIMIGGSGIWIRSGNWFRVEGRVLAWRCER